MIAPPATTMRRTLALGSTRPRANFYLTLRRVPEPAAKDSATLAKNGRQEARVDRREIIRPFPLICLFFNAVSDITTLPLSSRKR